MLAKRLISVAILVPLLIASIFFGGWWLVAFLSIFVGFSAWEFGKLFMAGGYKPSLVILIIGSLAVLISRQFLSIENSLMVFAVLILASMVFHTLSYQAGVQTAATDFTITLTGWLYLGFTSAYILSIRQLPDGMFWLLLTLPAISFADSSAYFIGRAIGKHKMMDRVSPKKTWEGYFGGIVVTAVLTPLLALFLHTWTPVITWQKGLILGPILGALAPFGDFGESMLKRQFNVKDSSQLIPGHGGFLDRVDSFLWTAVIGYYIIFWFLK